MRKARRLFPTIFILVLLVLTTVSVSNAAMYQWTDKHGRTHFTDHPGNIPDELIDKKKPIKGVYGTPDPIQYHQEDRKARMKRKEIFREDLKRQKRYQACERSCQRHDMFDTLTCVQTKCQSLR